MGDDWREEERWQLLQEARLDRHINLLQAAHDHGDHDALGQETKDCPACEERAQDEAATQAEQDGAQGNLRKVMAQAALKQWDKEDEKFDSTCIFCATGEAPGHEH